jgi:PAS domain S-box-containing protein
MPLLALEINSKSNYAGHSNKGIFNKLPFMVWALDEELNIVFWNPAAEKLIGYSREEVLYNNEIFTKLFPDPTIRDEYYQKINNCFPTVEWNVRIRCKNKSDKWISCFDIGNLYHIEGWKYVLIGIDRTDEKETDWLYKQVNSVIVPCFPVPRQVLFYVTRLWITKARLIIFLSTTIGQWKEC